MRSLVSGAFGLCDLCMGAWVMWVGVCWIVSGRRDLYFAVREQGGDDYFSVAYMEIFTSIIK